MKIKRFFCIFLFVLTTLRFFGCAHRGSKMSSYRQEATSAHEPPPSNVAPPDTTEIPNTSEQQKSYIDAWSRNLRWHGGRLGLDVEPLPNQRRSPVDKAGATPSTPSADTQERLSESQSRFRASSRKRRARMSRCERAYRHMAAICRASRQICRIAEMLDEPAAHLRCRWAKNQCRKARASYDKNC